MLNKIYKFVLEFKEILKSENSSNFDVWIQKAQELDIREANDFINGTIRDIYAVKKSITYSYSNGLKESSENKIPVIKRIMYGHYNFATLCSIGFLRFYNSSGNK